MGGRVQAWCWTSGDIHGRRTHVNGYAQLLEFIRSISKPTFKFRKLCVCILQHIDRSFHHILRENGPSFADSDKQETLTISLLVSWYPIKHRLEQMHRQVPVRAGENLADRKIPSRETRTWTNDFVLQTVLSVTETLVNMRTKRWQPKKLVQC